jgi:hypothetical protein
MSSRFFLNIELRFAEALGFWIGKREKAISLLGRECDFARAYSAPFLSGASKNKKRGKNLLSFRAFF